MKNMFNNPWFIAVIAVLSVGYFGYSMYGVLQPDTFATADTVDALEVDSLAEPSEDMLPTTHTGPARLAAIRHEIEWLQDLERDPFAQAQSVQEFEETLPNLEALFIGAGVQAAVINNRLVRVGDTIDDYEVTAIANEHVQVFRAGRSYRLEPDV